MRQISQKKSEEDYQTAQQSTISHIMENYREGLEGKTKSSLLVVVVGAKNFFLPNKKEIEAQEERIDLFHESLLLLCVTTAADQANEMKWDE